MNKQDAIDYFDGSVRKLAAVCGVTSQAVYIWPDTIPEAQAWRIQYETKGALSFDWRADYHAKGIRCGPKSDREYSPTKKKPHKLCGPEAVMFLRDNERAVALYDTRH